MTSLLSRNRRSRDYAWTTSRRHSVWDRRTRVSDWITRISDWRTSTWSVIKSDWVERTSTWNRRISSFYERGGIPSWWVVTSKSRYVFIQWNLSTKTLSGQPFVLNWEVIFLAVPMEKGVHCWGADHFSEGPFSMALVWKINVLMIFRSWVSMMEKLCHRKVWADLCLLLQSLFIVVYLIVQLQMTPAVTLKPSGDEQVYEKF